MSEYDSKNTTKGEIALSPQDISTGTTTFGNGIDTLDFDSLTYHVQSGLVTAGTFTFSLEESDDDGALDAYAAVPADNIIGTQPIFVITDDDLAKRVGSIGKKRFQRVSVLSAGVTGPNLFSTLAILGHAKTNPTAE